MAKKTTVAAIERFQTAFAAGGAESNSLVRQVGEVMQPLMKEDMPHILANARIPAGLQPTVAYLMADEMEYGGDLFGEDSPINDLSFVGRSVACFSHTSISIGGRGRGELVDAIKGLGRMIGRALRRGMGRGYEGNYEGEIAA